MKDLYKETIHHHDRSQVRIYRDYLTVYHSVPKAVTMRQLEILPEGFNSLGFIGSDTLLEALGFALEGLQACLEDLVRMGHVEYRFNGTNHTYRMRADVVQQALDSLNVATEK